MNGIQQISSVIYLIIQLANKPRSFKLFSAFRYFFPPHFFTRSNSDFVFSGSHSRKIRSSNDAGATTSASPSTGTAAVDVQPAVITGFRVEEVDKDVSYENGVSIVLAGATVSIILYTHPPSSGLLAA